MLILILPVAMGAGLAIQTAVNSKLRGFVASPYLSSGFSFLVAWLFLLVLSLITKQSILLDGKMFSAQPLWIWLGGLFGAIALTGNVVLFQKIGSLQTTVLPIMGQIVMSVLIDQFGWFHSPVNRINVTRVGGLVLVVLGVILSLGIFNKVEKDLKKKHINPLYQIFAVLAGMMMAVQTAINGHLGTILKSPVHASLISFTVGLLCLIIMNLVLKTKVSNLKLALHAGIHYWWIWVGGFIGALYVLCSSWLVPVLGTGQVVVLALFGQLVISALIEHFGSFESDINKITRSKTFGLVIMFFGVLVIKFLNF